MESEPASRIWQHLEVPRIVQLTELLRKPTRMEGGQDSKCFDKNSHGFSIPFFEMVQQCIYKYLSLSIQYVRITPAMGLLWSILVPWLGPQTAPWLPHHPTAKIALPTAEDLCLTRLAPNGTKKWCNWFFRCSEKETKLPPIGWPLDELLIASAALQLATWYLPIAMHTVFHLLQEKRCLHGPDGCVPKNRVIMCNYVCIYIYIHTNMRISFLYIECECAPQRSKVSWLNTILWPKAEWPSEATCKKKTLWSEWTASSWISFRCAFLLCSNCLFSYLWNSSWKKASVRQSCFGPGLKKSVFFEGWDSIHYKCLPWFSRIISWSSKQMKLWFDDLKSSKSQTLRTTPFVVIHSLSAGTPLSESMRLFQACFSRLNHTQSTVSKYSSFWDFDLDEYQKLHLSNCIEKPGFSIVWLYFYWLLFQKSLHVCL